MLHSHCASRYSAALAALLLALPLAAPAQPAPHERHGGGPGRGPGPQEWRDARYGHGHVYPLPGRVVTRMPGRPEVVVRGSSRYWFSGGVWYAPRGPGYVVVHPPRGIVVGVLPAFATVVTLGALTYYYANDVYYRPLPAGGYEVVDPPLDAPVPQAAPAKLYVYPRQGQTPEQQAGDEYACHRWAAEQAHFDPTLSATGQSADSDALRADYSRANAACLDGRGYTVR